MAPNTDRLVALEAQVAEMKRAAEQTEKRAQETHDMVEKLVAKLLVAQPGQEKSLLDRMAAVTIELESGKRGARFALWVLGFIAAVGAAIGAFQVMRGQG